ncbi:MAG: hypothetical protein HC936_13385 [Leptolyngbyaceae cyanobacterium SU_3_3]|nr:hypothetical protein [Leptolyngbyaceae cyanobacterium SU_3_3]NJR48283.1 hypothetical protein [Leptolyngbyaceae cyanobacterium CSU_1_3]
MTHPPSNPDDPDPNRWPTFAELVVRLHGEGIYIHPDQLAEFLLSHGLPVDLCYVPDRLKQKAEAVNSHYQGDMARLEEMNDPFWHPLVVPY